jgi:hypothetical protein
LIPHPEKKKRSNLILNPEVFELKDPEESRVKKWLSTSNRWLHLKFEQSRAKSIQVILRRRSFSTLNPPISLKSRSQRQLQEKTLKSPTNRATSPREKNLAMVVNPGKKNLTKRSFITSSRSHTKGLK